MAAALRKTFFTIHQFFGFTCARTDLILVVRLGTSAIFTAARACLCWTELLMRFEKSGEHRRHRLHCEAMNRRHLQHLEPCQHCIV